VSDPRTRGGALVTAVPVSEAARLPPDHVTVSEAALAPEVAGANWIVIVQEVPDAIVEPVQVVDDIANSVGFAPATVVVTIVSAADVPLFTRNVC
jgi:hypothetical protein